VNRSSTTIVVLIAALILTNGWWVYKLLDIAVTGEYQSVERQRIHEALSQVLSVLPVALEQDSTKEQVIQAAETKTDKPDYFEKDGYVWVGNIGLQFNEHGRLVEAKPAWSPF